jgi:hypothetical protein
MKLKNIKIENYRFFKEEQEFDFTSKDNIPQNILLYGENGSGKTSLYNALKDFFFYYKNQSESKTKIKENKNIFCEPTDKPKIEITFENDTNIKFSETGFENEDLKEKIEEVSKSKLFLTYQDIYNLNNMFKKDISYKDFKDIFTILYFDDLNHLFSEFEDNLKDFKNKIEDKDTLEENYNVIKRLIEEFDETFSYELDPIEKEDPIDKDVVPNVYDTVYYLDVNLLEELEGNKNNLVKFLDIWEQLNNPDFKPVEFDGFRKEAGLNSFTMSPTKWIQGTNAIGIVAKSGRYGGTYAHKDIAFEFASWVSVEFKLYLIKEFQRLKEQELKQLGWDIRRNLTKINYKIHTDAIKENLIPKELNSSQINFLYASEADILNVALFGMTAKEWREQNKDEI